MGFKAILLMGFILDTALNSFLKEKNQPTEDFEFSCQNKSLEKLKQKHPTPQTGGSRGRRYAVITGQPPPTVPYMSYSESPQLAQMLLSICWGKQLLRRR